MGGIFGSKKTSSSTVTPFSGETADRFNSLYSTLNNNLTDPRIYSGQMTAGENAAQKQAVSSLAGLAGNQALSDYASGKYLDPSSNPYLQKSLDIMKTNANNQFADTASAIDSRFNNRGFYDSSSHASTLDRAADSANENYNNAAAQLLNNQYNQGINNMFNAQSGLQSVNNALLNAGNTEYGISNDALQANWQKWLQEQNLNQQDIQNMLNYFNVGKNPTQTTTEKESGGLGGIIGNIAGKGLSKLLSL